MFERNKVGNEPSAVAVEIELTDGTTIRGKVVVPIGKSLAEALNGSSAFIEFEPYGDERIFLAKSQLTLVKPTAVPRAPNLSARIADTGGFDPYAVLGLGSGAGREEIRAAYVRLAKAYHPDRYAAAELPPEVCEYLAIMARRINAAHTALDTTLRRAAAAAEPAFAP
jgi:hypothetical protein